MVAVEDDGVALGPVAGRVKGADVGTEDVGCVGQIDDQWRRTGLIARVASKECWTRIETQVDKGVLGLLVSINGQGHANETG